MIDVYIKEIKCSLKNRCYFSALSLALILPDICSMVEYPHESSVAKRYINWYNAYLGEFYSKERVYSGDPYLSGELIYNLRNTFLHQGSPNVASNKIKEEANQLDKFALLLGDGTLLQQATMYTYTGNHEAAYKMIIVDVTFLCDSICGAAQWYYEKHKDSFSFDFSYML